MEARVLVVQLESVHDEKRRTWVRQVFRRFEVARIDGAFAAAGEYVVVVAVVGKKENDEILTERSETAGLTDHTRDPCRFQAAVVGLFAEGSLVEVGF
eukprot:m.18457 g.18457  ORF g.18457 m.18457 type:complete len:98 (-) comp11894_c0_seq1:66-359(-)